MFSRRESGKRDRMSTVEESIEVAVPVIDASVRLASVRLKSLVKLAVEVPPRQSESRPMFLPARPAVR